jgi:predicted negative regulator of RcsB-dependent stress response
MARSVIEANAAIGRVRAMPYGRARSEAAEREVRRIEREGPDEARAYALTSLVEALTWGDEYEKAFFPFTQLLRWWDEHPEHFDHYDQSVLFWEFGWIMSDLPQIPTVPARQVEATLDDMERRFAVANRGMERVWSTRLHWELLRGGDVEKVFTEWLTLPIDEEDSCAACHEALRGEYLLWRGDTDGAIAVFAKATDSDLACSREPAAMLTELALAYLDTGQYELVEETVPKALAELKKAVSTSLSSAYARIFEIYGRGRQPDLALQLLADRAKDLDTGTPYRRLILHRRVAAGARALVEAGFGATPVTIPGVPDTVAGLAEWAEAQARPLTEQFDRRNGTAEQSRRLERALTVTAAPRRLEFALPGVAQAEQITQDIAAALAKPLDEAAPDNTADSLPERPRVRLARQAAEEYWADQNLYHAAAAYEIAAEEAQEEGLLRESGWDWAEAGRCRQMIGNQARAGVAYTNALSRLRAAGAPVEELARVLVAWAPDVNGLTAVQFVEEAEAATAQLSALVAERGDGPTLDDVAGFGLTFKPLRRQLHARADIDDSVARVLATWGDDEDREQALIRARQAAEVYLSIGEPVEAAHAEWLAGRLAYEAGDLDNAAELLELALNRLRVAGRREMANQALVAEDLADVLQELGQFDRAKRVLKDAAEF